MKRMMWLAVAVAFSGTAPDTAAAQVRVATPRTFIYGAEDPNAARIGVYLGDSDLRDTLGVRVSSVVEGGPAAAAGIKAGDRITAIDGMSLRMTRLDAEDPMLNGMMSRRLTRALDDKTAGDEVSLQIWSDGATRTVRVKTVAARELNATRERALADQIRSRVSTSNRAALGVSLGGMPSKRDTLGVLVIGVTQDGPAERAGLIEGDRIARIGDVDLRVPREDAGDATLWSARMNRLTREMRELDVGATVTLTVWNGGRQREVRVTSVAASELRSDGVRMFYGDGSFNLMPFLQDLNVRIPNIEIPRIEIPRIDIPEANIRVLPRGGGVYYYRDGRRVTDVDVTEEVQRALQAAREARQKAMEVRNAVVRRRTA